MMNQNFEKETVGEAIGNIPKISDSKTEWKLELYTELTVMFFLQLATMFLYHVLLVIIGSLRKKRSYPKVSKLHTKCF